MAPSLLTPAARKLVIAVIFFATSAGAQTAPAAPGSPLPAPAPAWAVAGGYESFWLRDIAGTRPVDASPVAWQGQGPAIVVLYDRNHHHLTGSFSSASSFALGSPVQRLSASSNDRVRRLAGRYEYRWYPFRNVGVDGLDIGIGAGGDANHLMMLRYYPAAIEVRTQVINFGGSGVVAIRWAGSSVDIQAALGNGLTIGRSSTRHLAKVETSLHGWGGGWQTHLNLRAAVRVRPHTSVAAGYVHSGEGRSASHDSFTFGGSRIWGGVTYER